MDLQIILFCLMGGIVSADTDAAWQSMISQPLVACTVAGWLLGNIGLGWTVGALMQLPYLAEFPVGGARISVGNLGAFVASGVAIQLNELFAQNINLILIISILFGVILSYFTHPSIAWLRHLNLMLLRRAERAAENGKLHEITKLNYIGVLNTYLFGVVYVALFFLVGSFVLKEVLNRVPLQIETYLHFFKPMLLGAGVGAMFWIFVKRKTAKHTFLGVVLSAIIIFLSS